MKWWLALLLTITSATTLAHEVRPAYLELHEISPNQFHVFWKTPMRGELRLSLSPAFSGRTQEVTPTKTRHTGDAAVQTWSLKALDPLRGQTLQIVGLDSTMTDVLVRMEFADGSSWTQRLTPGRPEAEIPAHQSAFTVAGVYLELGVEHILTGIDHLLFVLALLIITRGGWKLIKTVTAFTLAHSITLALATLGFVHVPQRPVEAVIALSIVFIAAEILRSRRGRAGITEQAPWIVAFTFGLLHGFGFAGALSEVGLPQVQIPIALLFFNLGVEVGQLLFIATVLSLIAIIRRVRMPLPSWLELVPAYGIGSLAMFWVIQRVALF